MKNISLSILLVALPIMASAETSEDKSALVQMEKDWCAAYKSKDVAWLEKNFAEDMTDTSSGNGALRTKAEAIALFKVDKTTYESLELSNLEVRLAESAGVVTGVNHIQGRDDQGQPFEVKLAFTDTYIKRNGRWQVWASQHTRMPLPEHLRVKP